ncbi:3D domain-containing protein [Maribacter chungangensis]|uniref:3D domain-containing protein n=1 Tax=Maribacter chungangensis TaxID=1069117 RepID=A0ABW3B348_9FLAO
MGRFFLVLIVISISSSCRDSAEQEDPYHWQPLTVTATAYNSTPAQTSHEHPAITAWGDSIKPGVKWIAVSRDLLKKGLSYNTLVKIDTFKGVYVVKDKMHARWRNRIDIYMGKDIKKAREWGRRKIEIKYGVLKDTVNTIEE